MKKQRKPCQAYIADWYRANKIWKWQCHDRACDISAFPKSGKWRILKYFKKCFFFLYSFFKFYFLWRIQSTSSPCGNLVDGLPHDCHGALLWKSKSTRLESKAYMHKHEIQCVPKKGAEPIKLKEKGNTKPFWWPSAACAVLHLHSLDLTRDLSLVLFLRHAH